MDNWVSKFLESLYNLGFFDSNISKEQAIDGVGGSNTTNAYNKAKQAGYYWNNLTQTLEQIPKDKKLSLKKLNNHTVTTDSILFFKPSVTDGKCYTRHCAEFVNRELEGWTGSDITGHAWTNIRNANKGSVISGFVGKILPKKGTARNEAAANNFKSKLDTALLDIRLPYVTNFYFPMSNHVNDAMSEGYYSPETGKTTGTHTAITYWSPQKHQWLTTDNVGGDVTTKPFKIYLNRTEDSYGMRPVAMGAIGIPHYNYEFKLSDPTYSQVDTGLYFPIFNKNYDKLYFSYELSMNPDKVYEYTTNGETMFKDYPNGVLNQELLNSLNIYPNGELARYGNILSPLNINSLEATTPYRHVIMNEYGIGDDMIKTLYPLTLGILWKESNSGSNKYLSSRGIVDNTTFNEYHINDFGFPLIKPGFFTRWLGNYLTFDDMSSTSGSVKLRSLPITFGNRIVNNPAMAWLPKERIVANNMYAANNIMSNLARNYVQISKMLGDKNYVLFNNDGSLSDIGIGLLLESHNQGTEAGIKKSIDAFIKTGDIAYLSLFINREAAIKLGKNEEEMPTYGKTIFNTLKLGFNKISFAPTLLDNVEVIGYK